MNCKNLFDRFDTAGKLCLPDGETVFAELPWCEHLTFEGVALKHLVTAGQTEGQFSFHLVRIAPNGKIGNHVHLIAQSPQKQKSGD